MSNKVMSVASSIIGPMSNSKPMQWLGNKFNYNLAGALAATTMTSIVAKDGVGCAMYVYQSKNNKKIPDERRKFVTALDLTNGVLMIAMQLLMFKAVQKVSEPIFNKLFKKSFSKENLKIVGEKIRAASKEYKVNHPEENVVIPRKQTIDRKYQEVRNAALKTFKFITDVSAATIIGKRVLVPFIATPLADKVQKKMERDEAASNLQTDTPQFGQKLDVVLSSGTTNLLERYRMAALQNAQANQQ